MSVPPDPFVSQLEGAGLAAMITAIGAGVIEYFKRRKKPKTQIEQAVEVRKAETDDALAKANTAEAISAAFSSLLDELQKERRIDRHKMRNLEMSIAALNRRLDEVTAAAERAQRRATANELRAARNKRILLNHIDALCEVMRRASIDPPPSPYLEPDLEPDVEHGLPRPPEQPPLI